MDNTLRKTSDRVVPNTGTPPPTNHRPVLTEVSKRDVTERSSNRTAGVYEGTDPDGDALTWSLEGTDAASFQLTDVSGHSNRKTLSFPLSKAPNYEVKSSYSVTIKIEETNRPESEKLSKTFARTVTIRNGPDPGSITSWYPAALQACKQVTVTLTDEDDGITVRGIDEPPDFDYGFFWSPHSPASSVREAARSSSLAGSFTPDGDYARQKISVRAQYGDNYRNKNTADGISTAIVISNVPRKPTNFSGTPASRKISLSWEAPDHCGESITGYQYQYKRDDSDTWGPWSSNTTSLSATLTGLAHNTEYDLGVRARNSNGTSATSTTSATTPPAPPQNPRPPTISGDFTVDVVENTTSVGTYRASDPDAGDTISDWDVSPTSTFSLTESSDKWSADLAFNTAPNHETETSYSASITATDSRGLSRTNTVSITVTDGNDPPDMTISPQTPQAGKEFTLTVTDEDGVSSPSWRWSAVNPASRTEEGEVQGRSTASGTFPATTSAVGKLIRGFVYYTDSFGPNQTASVYSNTVVPGVPTEPRSFRGSRGDARVTLRWSAPSDDRGSSVTGYDYGHKLGTATTWTTANTTGLTKTITGLTNGSSYDFRVRAKNDVGTSSYVTDSVTPAGGPTPPRNFDGSRGDGRVVLRWSAPSSNGGSPITGYDYGHKLSTASSWTTGSTTGLAKTITGLTNGSEYNFRLRAKNAAGTSSYVTESVTPAGKPDAPSGFQHGRSSATSVTVSWDEPANNGSAITGYYWYKRNGPMWSPPTWVTDTEFTDDNSSNTRSHRYGFRAKNAVGESPMSEYTVPAEEQRSAKLAADFADSTGFGVLTAPNPFNSQTMIFLALPEEMPVTLTVHSITGQTVARLYESAVLEAGVHTIQWEGTDDEGRSLGSGIYLFRLVAGPHVRVGKMALIR